MKFKMKLNFTVEHTAINMQNKQIKSSENFEMKNKTFCGRSIARQIRPLRSVFNAKERTKGAAKQGLQRTILIPNLQCPAHSLHI